MPLVHNFYFNYVLSSLKLKSNKICIGSHAPVLRQEKNLISIPFINELNQENYDETELADQYDHGNGICIKN